MVLCNLFLLFLYSNHFRTQRQFFYFWYPLKRFFQIHEYETFFFYLLLRPYFTFIILYFKYIFLSVSAFYKATENLTELVPFIYLIYFILFYIKYIQILSVPLMIELFLCTYNLFYLHHYVIH